MRHKQFTRSHWLLLRCYPVHSGVTHCHTLVSVCSWEEKAFHLCARQEVAQVASTSHWHIWVTQQKEPSEWLRNEHLFLEAMYSVSDAVLYLTYWKVKLLKTRYRQGLSEQNPTGPGNSIRINSRDHVTPKSFHRVKRQLTELENMLASILQTEDQYLEYTKNFKKWDLSNKRPSQKVGKWNK